MRTWVLGFILVSSSVAACGKSGHDRPAGTVAPGDGGADGDVPGPAAGGAPSGEAGDGGGPLASGGGGGTSDGGGDDGGSSGHAPGDGGAGGVGAAGTGHAGDVGAGGAHDPSPSDPNIVFITSEAYVPATLGGPAGADDACNELAAAAHLSGTFVAWLSTSTVDARSRLGRANGWYNTRGRPFADRAAELLDADQVYYPINYDEHGQKVYGRVATGTSADGAFATHDCNDWQASDSNTTLVTGDANAGSVLWTNVDDGEPCSAEYHLYCFQIDNDAKLNPTPSQGRTVFISSEVLELGPEGRAAADALCAADAAAASLDGDFVALLPTATEAPTERLREPTRPWVRPDGMIVASNTHSAELDELDVAVTQHADGAYVGGVRVLGGPTLDTTSWLTCDDWTNPVDPTTPVALVGMIGYSDARWHAWNPDACSEPARVVCVEQ